MDDRRPDPSAVRLSASLENDQIDAKYGFERYKATEERLGWLINMHPTEVMDADKRLRSAVDYFFVQENGDRFKATLPFEPYFYVMPRDGCAEEVETYLAKKYSGVVSSVQQVPKEDMDLPNHLTGLKRTYIKMSFLTVADLMKVRRELLPAIQKTRVREKERARIGTVIGEMNVASVGRNAPGVFQTKGSADQTENMVDIREYDVPYHVRVSIDLKIFVGLWYSVSVVRGIPTIQRRDDILERPDTIVLAYDIETTKLPLKFPDASTDQIMMISYMVDGVGFLITNREVVSNDVEDFEFSPRPEFEGQFTVWNEPDEPTLLQRFFDHILEIRPHIFVTYNGDFFDWTFVEARAGIHGLDMLKEVGFAKNTAGFFACRPAIHMDCLCWVKRDSYLPVGSQGLKAVAKAKLRYDPVELDPEDMCKMAVEQPQVLANYSVSDAVATYYLYMKYVHPFIFALCTIIPMEPDEVLRKGSGTLCEALLMVQAFHANIIFPNKQEQVFNKMTPDGHVLDQETYVGGHVEALESGVFRADLPCRFRTSPEAYQMLADNVERTLRHAIVEEENVPMDKVTNFDQVVQEIRQKLISLRDIPARMENPIIYHLDVGAMYPNIILTNRLQPSAIVDESICAACDYNTPNARCQRTLAWAWRGEIMPASRSEYQRILQQLETESFPSLKDPQGPPKPFHLLPREEQAAIEKKRLQEFCRRAYRKLHVTRMEERKTTICQRENSFYVDTVRAFRDRRYEYKGLLKQAKKQVAAALEGGDVAEIKSAKNREVLFDSLQLAHKCILNSFYGYVMRKGARWYSMEMAGIVCYTGASIITRAREIVEKIGRPLELDTDGIWCVLPASFPENYVIKTSDPKKSKVTISYPGAMLNVMVKDFYTNDQYHELTDVERRSYTVRAENSIFFEVDGPYLAMVLPAAKEEGKKLKKRYAVFNFDGSLAELKGFEVKRRGELQLVKIFQSSVFEAFLKGGSLEECYASVAKVADYWLDVLYSRGENMPDSELFELISENRSMSKTLADYGAQKSTSISTAKRLAEFLGDQMVKDAGLSCKFIISRKPDGAPVTERAIPLAIFQAENSVKRYYLRRWLKDPGLTDYGLRSILDWNYYIERFSGVIQKIITIPAALQGISNPVPRVRHPDWLHKKLMEKNDVLKQRKISEMFQKVDKPRPSTPVAVDEVAASIPDVEDIGGSGSSLLPRLPPRVSRKRKERDDERERGWRETLGPPPPFPSSGVKKDVDKWLTYQKQKWMIQKEQKERRRGHKRSRGSDGVTNTGSGLASTTLGGFLRRAHLTLLDYPWQIIQVHPTGEPGVFNLWALVRGDLHKIRLTVPRIFYVNQRVPKPEEEGNLWKKTAKSLPRSHPSLFLYEYAIPEPVYKEHSHSLVADLSSPDIAGIYETGVPLDFRLFVRLGCVCRVDPTMFQRLSNQADTTSFDLKHLQFVSLAQHGYLETNALRSSYLYQHTVGNKSLLALIFPAQKKGHFFAVDTVRTNQMPNLKNMYTTERNAALSRASEAEDVPGEDHNFEVRIETDLRQVFRQIQRLLSAHLDEKRGPGMLVIQASLDNVALYEGIPTLSDLPCVRISVAAHDEPFLALDWQRMASREILRHYLRYPSLLSKALELSRYLHLPLGNLPRDTAITGADLFYSRHLYKANHLLWASREELPDLGGKEDDDSRLLSELDGEEGKLEISNPSCYNTVCVELLLDSLPVTALLQAPHIHDLEGTSSSVAFDAAPQVSLEDMLCGGGAAPPIYDESVACAGAFKVLRTLVASWLRDVALYENPFADFHIVHFYRWLHSPSALLHDPALTRILQRVCKKLFQLLIAEFQRLGSTIVFADFGRIVICTKKKEVPEALAYTEFVLQSILSKDLFHSLQLRVTNVWKYLVWLDPANFAGFRGSEDPDASLNASTASIDEGLELEMNWQVMQTLPEEGACRTNFATVIASFMSAMHQEWTRLNTVQGSQRFARGSEDALVEFGRSLIQGKLSQNLFLVVQKMSKKLSSWTPRPEVLKDPLLYKLTGTRNPTLQFVKAICRVLSLDSAMEEEVRALRRNLLRLIGVGEFSPDSEWSDPLPSLPLHDVICDVCNHCRDIDLTRDPHQSISNGRAVWVCSSPDCGSPYDTEVIEDRLIDKLKRYLVSYSLQDLECVRCRQVKVSNMSSLCECGGSFRTLRSASDSKEKFQLFDAVAVHYQMPLLKETLEGLISRA